MGEDAFLRALLANPEDSTSRLVYADWLEDRGDPRAGLLRLDPDVPRIHFLDWVQRRGVLAYYLERHPELHEQLWDLRSKRWLVDRLEALAGAAEPEWLAFMDTLGRPFHPFYFWNNSGPQAFKGNQLPFRDPIGTRGAVVTFESAFRSEECWDSPLMADLRFLRELRLGDCAYGAASCPLHPFVCELGIGDRPLTGVDVVEALKVREFRSEAELPLTATRISNPEGTYHEGSDDLHTGPNGAPLFPDLSDHEYSPSSGEIAAHDSLRRYVRDQTLWYGRLYDHNQPSDWRDWCGWVVLFAVGASACGRRLLGVLSHQARG